MFNWLFNHKKKEEMEEVKKEVRGSFDHVKSDIERISKWVNHLNNQDISLNSCLDDVKQDISTIKNDLEQVKEVISMLNDEVSKQVFKTTKPVYRKQTAVEGVQTAVQTAVQTGKNNDFLGISNLSVTEKAILWVLINNELKLSYDDLAAMLGKTRSTIRGQINSIKQKSDGLIEEYVESNGKKRVYIPSEIKEKILKNVKVRIDKKIKRKG
ncbi:hypothetical protein J4466_00380 [Candidatus Pacearchaeota archaeon]|nr:hypothetical protein [Candidatus Pacearchaeota archaeon]